MRAPANAEIIEVIEVDRSVTKIEVKSFMNNEEVNNIAINK